GVACQADVLDGEGHHMCTSGFCVDGFCCDTACGNGADDCQSCIGANTGGENGVCANISIGTNPDEACDSGYDCNGAGACFSAGNCSDDSHCADDYYCNDNATGSCLVKLDDGQACVGDTLDAVGHHMCANDYCVLDVCCNETCIEGSCQYCAADSGDCGNIPNAQDPLDECENDLTCNGAGACHFALGEACDDGADSLACESENCVDGVCCSAASCDTCEFCNDTGACVNVVDNTQDVGTCDAVSQICYPSFATEDNEQQKCFTIHGEACPEGCSAGDCDSCLPATDTQGTAAPQGYCHNGICCSQQFCGPCSACAWPGICEALDGVEDASTGCIEPRMCENGICKNGPGLACGTADDCLSDLSCVDGVCCNSESCGDCQACNVEESAGTCAYIIPEVTAGTAFADNLLDGESCGGSAENCYYYTTDTVNNIPTYFDGITPVAHPEGEFYYTLCLSDLAETCGGDGDNFCESQNCVDGVCCDSASCEVCYSCDVPDADGVLDGDCRAIVNVPEGSADDLSCSDVNSSCEGGAECLCFAGECKRVAGQSCTDADQCGSGFCVDGVCCNSACEETCFSCLAEHTNEEEDGVCAAISTYGQEDDYPSDICLNTDNKGCFVEDAGVPCKYLDGIACVGEDAPAALGAADCGSGFCLDGVCCNTESCDDCQGCNVDASGTCQYLIPDIDEDGSLGEAGDDEDENRPFDDASSGGESCTGATEKCYFYRYPTDDLDAIDDYFITGHSIVATALPNVDDTFYYTLCLSDTGEACGNEEENLCHNRACIDNICCGGDNIVTRANNPAPAGDSITQQDCATCMDCNVANSLGICTGIAEDNLPDAGICDESSHYSDGDVDLTNSKKWACFDDGAGAKVCQWKTGEACPADGVSADCGTGYCTDNVCCTQGSCPLCKDCQSLEEEMPGSCQWIAQGAVDDTCDYPKACYCTTTNQALLGCDSAADGMVCDDQDGQSCTVEAQTDCGSNRCIDGVCCSLAFISSDCPDCYDCDEPSMEGICAPILASGQEDTNCPSNDGVQGCYAMCGAAPCALDGTPNSQGDDSLCLLADSQACAESNQCQSWVCEDTVCCNSSCNVGQPDSGVRYCKDCNVSGNGTCTWNDTDGSNDAQNCLSINNEKCYWDEGITPAQWPQHEDNLGANENKSLCRGVQGHACGEAGDIPCAPGLFCVDGACCDVSACDSCYSCNIPGSAGACTALEDGAEDNYPADTCNANTSLSGAKGCFVEDDNVACKFLDGVACGDGGVDAAE
ncbi:MAG: hypothetical protein QGI45_17020, partial [Myxococcota bacterium]|nr:hypothetical protein [Myxococcota bacterium]